MRGGRRRWTASDGQSEGGGRQKGVSGMCIKGETRRGEWRREKMMKKWERAGSGAGGGKRRGREGGREGGRKRQGEREVRMDFSPCLPPSTVAQKMGGQREEREREREREIRRWTASDSERARVVGGKGGRVEWVGWVGAKDEDEQVREGGRRD